MIYDIHVHIAGLTPISRAQFSQPLARQSPMLRYFARRMGIGSAALSDAELTENLKTMFLAWVEESTVDRVVVLALDAAHRADGTADFENTVLMIGNDEVADLVSQHRKLLFGASIHPARQDAIGELERMVKRGACLVKWIPSAQNICPDDAMCFPFYEALAHHRLPLLVHTGNEHTVRRFSNSLSDPRCLKAALERGVTVIGAHCGTRLFLHERSYFEHWKTMALDYENFYGDLSAFVLPLHGSPLREILKDRDLAAKVLYGSDFPVLIFPFYHLFALGIAEAAQLNRIMNPFDRAYLLMKHLGVPNEVYEKAEGILRLPNASPPVGHGRLDGAA